MKRVMHVWAKAAVVIVAVVFTGVSQAHACTPAGSSCVVGTGTPSSCTESALDVALAGGGSVTFDCGPSAATVTITATKTIEADTTIDGGGRLTLSGGDAVAVLSVQGVRLSVENLTIADGNDQLSMCGAGICNGGTVNITNSTLAANKSRAGSGGIGNIAGTLTVTNSTFSNNSGGIMGGGAIGNYFAGTLVVLNSTFVDNAVTSVGGGIYNDGGSTTTVTSSSFLRNSTSHGYGGGIANWTRGTLVVMGSTFSENASYLDGGGLWNQGVATVTNSTFALNSSGARGRLGGGAIANLDGIVTITNSTFHRNTASGSPGMNVANGGSSVTIANSIVAGDASNDNCVGAITDGGHNVQFPGNSCGATIDTTDPLLDLAGLAGNGGPTLTIGLRAGSPAIHAGDETVCAATTGMAPVNNLDQRGYVRPGQGSTLCSIGAFEFASVAATPSSTPTYSPTPTITPTPIPQSATATITPTPTSTASPTPTASATATQGPCVGDCNGDGEVTVNELIQMTNIGLGFLPLSTCVAGDASMDGEITVNEIIAAVNNALNGCFAGAVLHSRF